MKEQVKPDGGGDRELTPLNSARLGGSDIPERVRIAPWGEVDSSSGRFVVDEDAARLVLDAFERHGTDLPIDYEHQTLGGPYASPTGQAPAAGWIKRLETVPGDGLYAVVEWTEPAREQLVARQYRYLSPVAVVRKSDRKLVGLHSVALTNKPAIVGAEPIVSKVDDGEGAAAGALQSLRNVLKLDAECDVNTVLVAASRKFDELDRNRAVREADERVGVAIRQGRLTEAQREFAIELALREDGLFDRWLRSAPVVVPVGRIAPPREADGGNTRHAVVAHARAEFRAHPELAAFTAEEAFVNDAVRQAGLSDVEV
jgi:phage I-like protein